MYAAELGEIKAFGMLDEKAIIYSGNLWPFLTMNLIRKSAIRLQFINEFMILFWLKILYYHFQNLFLYSCAIKGNINDVQITFV